MQPASRRRRSGFTLIELLLALAIALLISIALFSVHRTVMRSLEGQQRRVSGISSAAQALVAMGQDLEQTVLPADEEACIFNLSKDELEGGDSSRLSFCAATLEQSEVDARWYSVANLTYRLAPASRGKRVLIREVRSLVGPAGTRTNIVAAAVVRFDARVDAGSGWTDSWTPSKEQPRPLAVSIELQVAGDPPLSMQVAIPAGTVFRPPATEVRE